LWIKRSRTTPVEYTTSTGVLEGVWYVEEAATDDTQVLSITVSDGTDTATDSLTFLITASCTLIVYNDAYYPVYSLYVVPNSSATWGVDLLDSDVLAVDSSYKYIGMAAGSWKISYNFYYDGSPGSYNYIYNQYFYKGVPRTLNVLAGGTWSSMYPPVSEDQISTMPGWRQVKTR